LGVINLSRPVEAEEILQDLMPRLERVLGSDDPLSLEARHVFAITRMYRGTYDEAERLLLELRAHPALAGAEADVQQIRIIHTLNSIALRRMMDVDRQQGLPILKKTEPLARERVERATRRYGVDSPNQFHAQARLADIVRGLGRNQEAASLARDVLNRSVQRLGECHFVRAEAMSVLAEALTALGESREPADLRMKEVACTRARVGPSDPVMLSVLSDSLRYLERAGDGATGESLARELIEALGQFGGGHGDMLFAAECYLARFISMQGRHDDAEKLFASLPRGRCTEQTHSCPFPPAARSSSIARPAIQAGEARDEHSRNLQVMGGAGTWATHPDDITLGFIALFRPPRRHQGDEYQRLARRRGDLLQDQMRPANSLNRHGRAARCGEWNQIVVLISDRSRAAAIILTATC
jgi:hypothetical protein